MLALSKAFLNGDRDLLNTITIDLPQVMQTLFVCTGCDYTFFFSQIGEATFWEVFLPLRSKRYFYQYGAFMTGRKCSLPVVNVPYW